jgi:hypothetical protein
MQCDQQQSRLLAYACMLRALQAQYVATMTAAGCVLGRTSNAQQQQVAALPKDGPLHLCTLHEQYSEAEGDGTAHQAHLQNRHPATCQFDKKPCSAEFGDRCLRMDNLAQAVLRHVCCVDWALFQIL